jgi:hypothetical protein
MHPAFGLGHCLSPRFARWDIIAHPMDLARDGNLIEAGVWFVLALVLGIRTLFADRRLRLTTALLVVALVSFGFSDMVESRTGAWWRPWWLFLWKVACVALLAFGFFRYYRLTKRHQSADPMRHDQ